MIALTYIIQDGIDLRGVRIHPGNQDDIGRLPCPSVQSGRGILVDGDLRAREKMGQALISDKCAIRYLVLPPESNPPVQFRRSPPITGRE